MAEPGSQQPNQPKPPSTAPEPPRQPLQVMHISRRDDQERLRREADEAKKEALAAAERARRLEAAVNEAYPEGSSERPISPNRASSQNASDEERFGLDDLQGMTMDDLLGGAGEQSRSSGSSSPRDATKGNTSSTHSVDDFDFDEDAFLAALDENAPVGTAGEVVKGKVIALESDGVYVDIGGKAPGFMPKSECGLGVITNLRERFPKGLEIEVLVTREQNADGMVTISCRALALRQSWDKVKGLAKDGKVAQVKINGFNRGGVTCELEGLRGFIPRSQLLEGENHEALVGKTVGVAFLEVNPETRKLVLSEKRATTAARFSELEIGQLVEGQVVAVKPYGFFIDLGGVSGLLHQSMLTGGSLRSLREVFDQGERVKALITELDPGRGRIALNTALLEGQPGELLVEKEKVMAEATERANKARLLIREKEQSGG